MFQIPAITALDFSLLRNVSSGILQLHIWIVTHPIEVL
jgi:hypothetical protein